MGKESAQRLSIARPHGQAPQSPMGASEIRVIAEAEAVEAAAEAELGNMEEELAMQAV